MRGLIKTEEPGDGLSKNRGDKKLVADRGASASEKREVGELEKNRGKEEWRLKDRGCKMRNQKNRGGRTGKGKKTGQMKGNRKGADKKNLGNDE